MLNDINLRKIGMMFLIFTLVFTGIGVSSGMPVSYAAEEETPLEIYVSSGGDNTTGDGTREKPYATLSMAYSRINDGGTGTIYLLDNITQTTKNGEALKLNVNNRVTITTAPGVERVTIKRGEPSGTNALDTHFDLTKGELTLKNIIIDSNFNNQKINARIVNVFGGSKLIIEEGAILRGSNSGFNGSVIHVDNTGSVVEMKGGAIRDNNSTGAAVLVDNGSQFIMTGGLITDNIGGGVTFRSTPGGMLLLSGEARITGNTNSSGKALNVNMANYKNLILDDAFTGEAGITTQNMVPGTQFGRVTEDGLGSIENLIADYGPLLASYDENKNLVWRSFKNDLNQPSTDGEITGKNPTLSGVTEPFAKVTIAIVSAADQSIVITEERTADENGNWELPIDEALNKGAYTINVTANKNKTQSNTVTRQFGVETDVYVSNSGDDTAGDGTRNNPYATLHKAYQEVDDGGTIFVLNNIDLLVTADKKYLHLNQNKSVTISTASGVDTAVIQRGSNKDAASGESGDLDTLIHLEKGQLTLKNIIINAKLGEDFYRGRIMNVYNDSKLIIEEGAILRNSPSSFGGTAIYLKGGSGLVAVLEMKGGEITGNKHVTSGQSAVLIVDNAEFIMSGGKITDNSGGGVDLSTNTNTRFVLSGTAHITGNKGSNQPERNVILQGNTLLTLNDDFTGEAGITAHNRMNVGNKFGVAAKAGLAGLENLFSDNSHLLASYGEGNNDLVWKLFKNELSQPSTNGEITGTKPTLSGVTVPFAKVTIKIVSAADSSIVITEERTADENGNWELPVDEALSSGAYTINVTASINKNQSETVNRQFVVVDKTALQKKVDDITAENLVETKYTEASWNALQEAMNAAKDVLGNPAATQEEVNTALAALEKARNELTEKPVDTVDKTALQKKVDDITAENLVETRYTEASWNALQEAMNAAKDVLGNPAATQEEVNTALAALEKARNELTEKPVDTVDKTALQKKVDDITAENLVETRYTEASWNALQEAMNAAKDVLGNPAATQEEVNTALAALEKARNELTEKPVDTVDKTALQKKVDDITAENLVETKYTEASWNALQEAMNAAKDVLGNPAATQEEVNIALAALEKARNELTEKPVDTVDKTALQKKVDDITAENLVETEYTEASWNALQEAMNAAKDVLGNPAATQEEVNIALSELTKARDGLKKPDEPTPTVDKTKLQAKVDDIKAEKLKEEEYTSASWAELKQALEKADAVLADPNATQQEVDEALSVLTQAREGLKKPGVPTPTVDKSKLQAKEEQIKNENLKAEDYTPESWEELQKALEKADAVLADPNATQQEVDEALSVLTQAREGLKKPGVPTPTVDKSKLQAKEEQIKNENLKAEDYTPESWEELQKALQKADAVLADPNATQQEVDEALSALKKAREGLKKPSVPTPTPTVDKSKLQAKADEIQSEDLTGEDYTGESWEELQKALEKANAVLADRNATQEEVDKALSALTKAREGLKKPDEPTPTVDKSKLQAKVDEIGDEDLDEDDYTSSSWRKLEKALERAKDVLGDPDATQDEVDEALAELKKARRGLESVDKRDRDREKERKKDRESTNHVQNPFFTGGGSGYVEPKPSEPPKEENDQTGYMNGYPTGNFDPNRQVTRAEMASILVNTGMVKTTSASGMFMDVADQHWAADAIRRANEAGLMNGYSNGTFNPGGGITRAEMATIVYKHLGLNGESMPNNFYDVPADHWATQIIAAVSKEGYMAGYPDGTFHPQNTLTRAETVTIINRLLNHSQLSTVIGQSWPDVPPTHWAYKDIEAATKK